MSNFRPTFFTCSFLLVVTVSVAVGPQVARAQVIEGESAATAGLVTEVPTTRGRPWRFEFKQKFDTSALAPEEGSRAVRMKTQAGALYRFSKASKLGVRVPFTNSSLSTSDGSWHLNDIYLNGVYTQALNSAGFTSLLLNSRLAFPTGEESLVRTGNEGSFFQSATLTRPAGGRFTTHLVGEAEMWSTTRDYAVRRDGSRKPNTQNVLSETFVLHYAFSEKIAVTQAAGLLQTVRRPYKTKPERLNEGILATSMIATLGEKAFLSLTYQQTRDFASSERFSVYDSPESEWILEWSWVL